MSAQAELFPAAVGRREPPRWITCHRCAFRWWVLEGVPAARVVGGGCVPVTTPVGATYAVCPRCLAVVAR